MKTPDVVTLGAALLLLAGCGSVAPTAGVGTPAAQDAATPSAQPVQALTATPPPTPAPTPAPTLAPVVGQMITLQSGATFTVYSINRHVPLGPYDSPAKPGDAYWSVNVQQCASPTATGVTSANEFNWSLQTADNSRYQVGIGVPTVNPGFTAVELAPGQCLRGNLGYEVPLTPAPVLVVFNGYDADFNSIILRWTIR